MTDSAFDSIQNHHLKSWLLEVATLTTPSKIHICDGSEEEKAELTKQALETGELIELNQEKLPGCYLHRTNPNDVARVENLTFICTEKEEDAGPTNNWMAPQTAKDKVNEILKNVMTDRTMYVVPYIMGPANSPFSLVGIEITDSIYVVLNMRIMTRMGKVALDRLKYSENFSKGIHSKADVNPDRRFIMHFPEENLILSVGSGYGGNVLLSKKCLALRIASYLGNKEGWLAEHMLILGVEDPQGKITYIAAAFPSACGKTNLAMLVPPESMPGYKVWTVGDDIAWMHIGEDGRLYAINPENGFFGVAPGTNSETNPNAVKSIQKDTIYTNVVLREDGTVWWEGHDDSAPAQALDWTGNHWTPESKDAESNPKKGAQANSRFTAPAKNCPCISPNWEDPNGVPISAIVFGGRRASLSPLVYEARNWNHGVYMGATMASERTAAQYGLQGEVRRDPFAMLPFCGYNMADYFKHWIEMGKRITNPPKLFHVNWFRQDSSGKFLWPGFGENLKVLKWVIDRTEQSSASIKSPAPSSHSSISTPIGFMPSQGTIDALPELFEVNREEWLKEIESQNEFFDKFGDKFPQELKKEQETLRTAILM